jgi:hypothetical protein
VPPARLRRWLNAMIVTAVLDRVRDEDGEPIFLLKKYGAGKPPLAPTLRISPLSD